MYGLWKYLFEMVSIVFNQKKEMKNLYEISVLLGILYGFLMNSALCLSGPCLLKRGLLHCLVKLFLIGLFVLKYV